MKNLNILKDFEETARTWFSNYGVDCSSMTRCEVVEGYLNVENRLIGPRPREVFLSNVLGAKQISSEISSGLEMIGQKIRDGQNVTGHLTRHLVDPKFTDKLFSDWGIQHLHLSASPHPTIRHLFEGTKHVLFAIFNDNGAYLIDIDTHTDAANKKYPFAERQLLQIVADQWPVLLEPYRIPWAIGLEFEMTEAEDIDSARSRGINVFHMLNGVCYMPAGGGITTAGTSISVRRQMNEMSYMNCDVGVSVKNWRRNL